MLLAFHIILNPSFTMSPLYTELQFLWFVSIKVCIMGFLGNYLAFWWAPRPRPPRGHKLMTLPVFSDFLDFLFFICCFLGNYLALWCFDGWPLLWDAAIMPPFVPCLVMPSLPNFSWFIIITFINHHSIVNKNFLLDQAKLFFSIAEYCLRDLACILFFNSHFN